MSSGCVVLFYSNCQKSLNILENVLPSTFEILKIELAKNKIVFRTLLNDICQSGRSWFWVDFRDPDLRYSDPKMQSQIASAKTEEPEFGMIFGVRKAQIWVPKIVQKPASPALVDVI